MAEMETFFCGESELWSCGELTANCTEEIFSSSNATNMAGGTFTLSPLELHENTLPNIFSLKDTKSDSFSDVLFSFKSSPQVMSPMPYTNNYPQSQQLLSPNGYSHSPNYCLDQTFSTNTGPPPAPTFGAPFVPSMSVNVSMNMTMGYLPSDPALTHQMNWATPHVPPASGHGPSSSANYPSSYSTSPTHAHTHQNFCHQPYTASYSFAADFRPDAGLEGLRSQWMPSSSLLTSASALSTGSRSFGSTASLKRVKSSRSSENVSPTLSTFGSKSNLCRICGKTYARPSTLKTHLRTHSGEKPYRCGECHKSFSQAANLTAHVRTHSGEKPFRCPICDRRFSQSSSVTTHMRTHSGERPYRCRLCKKAFSDSSTLTKHLRIHSGEKPYQCKLCLLRFSQSGNLNRHMRVHSNP